MNCWPDIMILDFCEWLKNKVAHDYKQRELDVLDFK